ncbi:MAG: hypothetical protein RL508_369 [Actinomycetota bacterium]|jgi:LacI family transcriptional regulator
MAANNRPSVQDVARLAGVAIGTVSNVLNNPDKVRSETIEKVNAAIAQLGFVRNDAARQLKAGKSQTVGLVVLDSTNPFFGQLARGAEDFAMEQGYSLILGNSGNDELRERKYLNLFEQQRMAGVLVSPVGEPGPLVTELQGKGLNVVLVDAQAEEALCCSVGVDDVSGGRAAANHLLQQGRRRLAFVGGPLSTKQVAERLHGAKEAVSGYADVTLNVMQTTAMTVLAGRAIGEEILALPNAQRPDAIFAANDLLAVGLLQALVYKNQVQVPGEIAIIGYDDIDFAETAIVPLSSIRQPAEAIGATALQLLVDEIDNTTTHAHRHVMFQPELVVRASTLAPTN